MKTLAWNFKFTMHVATFKNAVNFERVESKTYLFTSKINDAEFFNTKDCSYHGKALNFPTAFSGL